MIVRVSQTATLLLFVDRHGPARILLQGLRDAFEVSKSLEWAWHKKSKFYYYTNNKIRSFLLYQILMQFFLIPLFSMLFHNFTLVCLLLLLFRFLFHSQCITKLHRKSKNYTFLISDLFYCSFSSISQCPV